jgi:hypothetical protein
MNRNPKRDRVSEESKSTYHEGHEEHEDLKGKLGSMLRALSVLRGGPILYYRPRPKKR